MNRAIAIATAGLLAAACSAPQVDLCGKTCPGAGASCGPGYYCNATTNTCQTNDNACPPVSGGISGGNGGTGTTGGTGGQTNGGSTGGGGGRPLLNSACTPPTGTAPDPCLADDAGLACNLNSSSNDVCTFPLEYETCVASIGCASQTPPLVCTDIQFTGGTSAWECVNDCTQTTDCPNPQDVCEGTFCYADFCGPGSLPDGGSLNPGGYYAPCDSNATNDGTCLPYAGNYGVCEENGTLAAGQLGCGNRPTGGGTTTLCASGSLCIYSNLTGASMCSPLCAFSQPPAGPACNASTTCENDGLFGDCETTCTTTAMCPNGLTCQGSPNGTCLP